MMLEALIIAAGKGSRLKSHGEVKPLVKLKHKTLIQRIIEKGIKCGINSFYVITGYKSSLVEQHMEYLRSKLEIHIKTIFNDQWSEKSNGTSVLKGKGFLNEKFFLLMSDHLFNERIVIDLTSANVKKDEVILAVDRNVTNNKYVDYQDATKVLTENNRIVEIGKKIKSYNCFDTGIFYCTSALFSALEESIGVGDDSLTGGIRILSRQNKAFTRDIKDHRWIDIDNEKTYKIAEHLLEKKQI